MKQRRFIGNMILPNPSNNFLFGRLFFLDYLQFFNGTIHANTILPIIGALIVLGCILYANAIACLHSSLPNSLLHASHINLRLILRQHHLFNTKGREVSLGASRITNGHTEVALCIAIQRNGRYMARMVGAIFGRIVGRLVIGISINTEDAEIARMARPHPIVGVPSELTHRSRRSIYQPHIVIVAIGR